MFLWEQEAVCKKFGFENMVLRLRKLDLEQANKRKKAGGLDVVREKNTENTMGGERQIRK